MRVLFIASLAFFIAFTTLVVDAKRADHSLFFNAGEDRNVKGSSGSGSTLRRRFPRPQPQQGATSGPDWSTCEVKYYDQKLDHFSYSPMPAGFPSTFKQRVVTCGLKTWRPGNPIIFWTGNEVDVTLLVNTSGIAWMNQKRLGALLVFAECRYFGKSLPFPGEPMPKGDKLKFLTVENILRDYAELVGMFKKMYNSEDSFVVAMGGSFGGMLSAYARNKYPNKFDGAIAGSAPVIGFTGVDGYNPQGFALIETRDATTEIDGGKYCAEGFVTVWNTIMTQAAKGDFDSITKAFRTCKPVASVEDAQATVDAVSSTIYYLAMGSYSWPSGYMLLGGKGTLPPYPLKQACSAFYGPIRNMSASDLMFATMNGMMVYFNATGKFSCYNPDQQVNEDSEVTGWLWGYLACGSMFMPMSQNGAYPAPMGDMMPPSKWNQQEQIAMCQTQYAGTTPDLNWANTVYGAFDIARETSNVIWSNGELDPWRPNGIQPENFPAGAPKSSKAIVIENYGHHADLFFSHPDDSAALKAARALELQYIESWIAAKKKQVEERRQQQQQQQQQKDL